MKWRNAFRTSEELHRFKRYAVLREATRIISRRGFHNASLDEIAEGLGISKGTLYNYVSDKQEILFDCHMIALDLGDHACKVANDLDGSGRSEEHTSELQSLMRISYAVFCLKKKTTRTTLRRSIKLKKNQQ